MIEALNAFIESHADSAWLLPVVLLLGIAAHGRLVEINREEVELVLAMNRLRHAYLKIAPALEPYFTTGHHDDEQGLAASYLTGGRRLRRSGQFLVNTPTIVATVDELRSVLLGPV